MSVLRLPLRDWGRSYSRENLSADLIAALVVTVMLIPQGMAYAMLAGLPPQAGLYGSIIPLLIYAALGSSSALAVGPVAVVALMTAATAGSIAEIGTPGYQLAALWIAMISGALMLAMGLLRLGFVANFLSHPVISGFITAAGILIAASQIRHLLGIQTSGKTLPEVIPSIIENIGGIHWPTVLISALVLAFLIWSRKGLAPALRSLGLAAPTAALLAKGGLFLAVLASTLATWILGLDAQGLRIVGDIPRGLPPLALPAFDMDLITYLLVPSALIALVGYVESISIAQTLAAKRRQRVSPDRELIALGAANLGAGLSQAMPVTGGLSRSIVNYDAGARTKLAGAMTALMIGAALLALTPLLYFLPNATLAAIIIVAVLSLLDFGALPRAWTYSKADGAAMAATMAFTLVMGVEQGLAAGVGLSIVLHLYRTSRPHVAEVGQVPGTGHFRNVDRYEVVTAPEVVTLRVDESLYFPNARYLEELVQQKITENPALKHLVLMFSAVNEVDTSALESLEMIQAKLRDAGVTLHLSEVKGPVMDRLRRSDFLDHLDGLYLTQLDAMEALAPTLTRDTLARPRHEVRKPGA
ncbi:MAG: sulfate permease, SulP family [Rhodobacteraceae bacterium HLUCCA12]|nr:MAG: sulfate permease, SulP family [Rhodobacteraceae bacterium HLUCCA12]